MNGDAVFWGSIATVVLAIVIFVFLSFKIKSLMKSDAEKHNS